MSNFYIKYRPGLRGVHSMEYLEDYLEGIQYVRYQKIMGDIGNIKSYGNDNGDTFTKTLEDIQGRFSVVRLSKNEMIGACRLLFTEYSGPETDPGEGNEGYEDYIPPEYRTNFVDLMAEKGIEVEDELEDVKKYRLSLFKQLNNKKFVDYNDSIGNLSKIITLLELHKDNLDSTQQARYDNLNTQMMNLYDIEMCLDAYEEMINDVDNILGNYRNSKSQLNNASNVNDAKKVKYQ